MLKGISPVISPDLLYTLHVMGHGDEIVLADAHFPTESLNDNNLRADGVKIQDLLMGILPLFEIDTYVNDPVVMMNAVNADTLDSTVEEAYLILIKQYYLEAPAITRIDRFAFYERARNAFAIVITGELAKYGNIILKKGVTPV
jgi:L-fucose mutarotase